MASEKNLNAVFSDIANSIRSKKGTTGTIQPVNMASEIDSIETGSSEKSTIYKTLEARGTNWNSVFYGNSASVFYVMETINQSDIPNSSNVDSMSYMFRNCYSLRNVPQLDTSNVTNMSGMFYGCNFITNIPLFNTSKVTDMSTMFNECILLKTIPQFDTSNVENMSRMFESCRGLTTIPSLNVGNVTNMNGIFSYCYNLQYIYMKNIKVNLDISFTALQHDALVELINNGLATVTATQTLTMGSTKLALLSDSEKQVALDKGWTLA